MVTFTLPFASHHLTSVSTIWMVLIYDATALNISPAGFQLHFHMLPLPRPVFELKCLQFVLLRLLPLTAKAQPSRYPSVLPGYCRMKYILALLIRRPSACICLQLMGTWSHAAPWAPSHFHWKLGTGGTSQSWALEAGNTYLQWTDYKKEAKLLSRLSLICLLYRKSYNCFMVVVAFFFFEGLLHCYCSD